jgi:hypothetical protein
MKRVFFIATLLGALFLQTNAALPPDPTDWSAFTCEGAALPNLIMSSGANGLVMDDYQPSDGFSYTNMLQLSPPSEGVEYWHGFSVQGVNRNHPTGYYSGYAIGSHYATFEDIEGSWTDVLKLEPPVGGYQSGTMIMTYPVTVAGKYTLSMDIWVEDVGNTTDIIWHNFDGTAWSSLIQRDNIQRGTWIKVNGELILGANEDIGLLAFGTGNNGLRTSTIYIKDLKFAGPNGSIVPPEIFEFKLNPNTLTLRINKTEQLNANNAVNNWTSSDEAVATVDANGIVTAVGVGEALITAISKDNETASAHVHVVE